jgi:DNA invertase Pin-like site-specific DNA recombinase
MTGPGLQKIKGQHLERLAVVYLRQSSARQVRENFRSTERQYGLAEEAVKLGWEPERVVTIDGDLRVSGRDAHPREAYKELVGRVCLGEVGAIFGLEVSRLARSSAETQRLFEYCGLTDALVIDTDRIYDLRDFNDQLVLGVKGQLAQAELHMMGVRLQDAKRHAAERGELRFPLPVGLVYDADGRTIIDADEEVQAAIADVFKAFWQTGSAYGVVGAFAGRRFPRRAYGGAWAGELRSGRLTHARVRGVVRNPSYAGAYVFGRYRYRRLVKPDGVIVTSMVELSRAESAVVIHDHHEGYISWEQFLANQQRLAQNHTRKGQRPPREGHALCQGIVRCGGCGGSMTTLHRREGQLLRMRPLPRRPRQHPGLPAGEGDRRRRADRPSAASGARARGDRARACCRRRASGSPRTLGPGARAARRARPPEAIRAERAFHACEPDNRLVARSLENRWEEKLRELKDAEAELAEHVVPEALMRRRLLDRRAGGESWESKSAGAGRCRACWSGRDRRVLLSQRPVPRRRSPAAICAPPPVTHAALAPGAPQRYRFALPPCS